MSDQLTLTWPELLDRARAEHEQETRAAVPIQAAARASDPETSHTAAASMTAAAAVQRLTILRELRSHGAAIANELDVALGWRDGTTGRRLVELERLGLVRKTGKQRPTVSRRKAFEYEVSP